MAERCDTQADEVRALPEPVAILERRARRVLDGSVGAANRVAGALERLEGLAHPAPASLPVRDLLLELAGAFEDVGADGCVERQLHLIDGHAVGIELERPAD